MSFFDLIPVFLGGGIGAVLRWFSSVVILQIVHKEWLGTLFVNLIGCTLIFISDRWLRGQGKEMSLLVRTGFLGGLTTFSTFSYEIVIYYKGGQVLEAVLMGLLNIVFGILIGIWVLR